MFDIPTLFTVGLIAFLILGLSWFLEEKWCAYMRPRVESLKGWGILFSFLMCVFWFLWSTVLIIIAVTFMGVGANGLVAKYF